jgi:hypothetical protein
MVKYLLEYVRPWFPSPAIQERERKREERRERERERERERKRNSACALAVCLIEDQALVLSTYKVAHNIHYSRELDIFL